MEYVCAFETNCVHTVHSQSIWNVCKNSNHVTDTVSFVRRLLLYKCPRPDRWFGNNDNNNNNNKYCKKISSYKMSGTT